MTHDEDFDLLHVMLEISREHGAPDPQMDALMTQYWDVVTDRCGGSPGKLVRYPDMLEPKQEN